MDKIIWKKAVKSTLKMYCFCMLWVLAACETNELEHSKIFKQIFLSKGATFRGTNLGDSFSVPLESEAPHEPKYKDNLGVTYEIDLDHKRRMFIEYYRDDIDSPSSDNRVAAIVANVLLEDELVTAQLYNELHDYFNTIDVYGFSRGTYGNYIWESQTKYSSRMEVILKLNDNKKGITLNFIDTRIDYNNNPI